MNHELLPRLTGRKNRIWQDLLTRSGLTPDEQADVFLLLWDGDVLAATGARFGNILKCIAVAEDYRGQDLTAAVLSQLRADAFAAGYRHLFLYTKPENRIQFSSLFFYPVVQTESVLLMEDLPGGIKKFLNSLPAPEAGGTTAALVMHCDPFTLGHRHLIETAAAECDRVLVFVLSEDRGHFPAAHRLALVQKGTADLPNVQVLPTGPYLISAATFPTYFLKNAANIPQARCQLDLAVFTEHFVPHFAITHRYVGTEPTCAVTRQYNEALAQSLPKKGIQVRQIPRLEKDSIPISAGTVRQHLAAGQLDALRPLVPETTFQYLAQKQSI